MGNVEKSQDLFSKKEPEVVVNLSRRQMKEELLQLPKGVAGMVWHVGSDTSKDAFNSVVVPEALRYGFVSWIQGKTVLEGMNIQPHYFPQLGLTYDTAAGKIVLDASKAGDLESALGSEKGFDFHPDGAPGWYEAIGKADNLGKIQLLKTHLASPTCSRSVLSREVIDYQPFIYRALVRGHVDQAKKLSSRVVISVDDPTPFSIETLKENLSIMFGDEFDAGRLISTEIDIMRAIHCCGDYDLLGAVETEAIDVVHWDAWKYGASPLIGKPKILQKFINDNGMFSWGGIPQNSHYLQELGSKLGVSPEATSMNDYCKLADNLEERKEVVVSFISGNYLRWLNATAKESGLNKGEIARRTFISASCGYGGNAAAPLRNFAYNLSQSVAELNREIAT